MWFWVVAALLVLVSLAALLRPLVARTVRSAGDDEATIEIFRRQLADIDADLAQGRLGPDEASAARAELTRRLLAETDREDKESGLAAGSRTELSWRIGAALGVAGLLPAAALAVYFAVGAPAAINSPAAASASRAAGTRDLAELPAAAEQLRARLERDPDHVEGWALLGRTLTRLQRFAEARDAYGFAFQVRDTFDLRQSHHVKGRDVGHTADEDQVRAAQDRIHDRSTAGKSYLRIAGQNDPRDLKRRGNVDQFDFQPVLLKEILLGRIPKRRVDPADGRIDDVQLDSILRPGRRGCQAK